MRSHQGVLLIIVVSPWYSLGLKGTKKSDVNKETAYKESSPSGVTTCKEVVQPALKCSIKGVPTFPSLSGAAPVADPN